MRSDTGVFLRMAGDRNRVGSLARPDGYARKTGACGDTIEMYIRGSKAQIQRIYFVIHGCVNTLACSNVVAHFVEGQGIDAAWDITPEQVIEFLETLPPSHHHCAELAVGTLYLALADLARAAAYRC